MPRDRIDPNDLQGRFNKLMGDYQRTLAELRALKGQQGTGGSPSAPGASQAPAAGSNGPSGAGDSTGLSSGQMDLSAEMQANAERAAAARLQQARDAEDQALAEQVMNARLEQAQQKALAKYPAIEPLLDMLSGADEAEYLSNAEALNAALGGQAADAAPPPPPEIPVGAGNPPLYAPGPNDAREAAKDRARATGDWSEYFRVIDGQARGNL